MPQPTEAPDAPDELVGPLERGLAVLRAVAAGPDVRHRPGDLARTTGLARSTVDRVATTLVRLGVLRAEGRDLLLAPGAAALGNAYLASCGLPELLGPHAVALADTLDESVSVAVPDGDGVRFLTQATRRRAMAISFRTGDLLPAERCAPGALFAARWDAADLEGWRARRARDPLDAGFPSVPPRPSAPPGPVEAEFLDRVRKARETGLAVDDQLIEPGLLAVALPVRGPDGAVVCAVSVVSHSSRHSATTLTERALPSLRRAVTAMEEALAAAGVPGGTASAAPVPSAPGLKEELGSGFLQSLARGLDVLSAFASVRGPARLSELARLTGLPRATARRSLITLRHLGYVREEPEGFVLLPRVLELGHARLSGLSLPEIATPHLVALVLRVHESASVAVLDGDDIRYVARVASTRIMHIDITVGTRLPAYATSMGRVLLGALPAAERAERLGRITPEALTPRTVTSRAGLDEAVTATAARGYGWVEQELEEGLRSLAVPVTNGTGRVVAAVNVALHAGRGPAEASLAALLPALRETAARISTDLSTVSRFSPTAPN
ncbi:IclR family transcriptional regulator C-terminal domain-containing protein [Streptomyces sp. SP18ES09]|uniref:IclR family transcriptional regulator domain-containing protein n=1 Tax=Streptomyces sp. SP18ES09 TaxID=3002532 RepID=UPI002E76BF1D|nr:IclR family transcriptional regulator C-terminal domain-containing protein [Streptomyces sp. SP18ES09]MEE1816071.1 IclR family transcriptional regulator C-terminal domain-containing protein [Streptomyces sp. SP18ES09]